MGARARSAEEYWRNYMGFQTDIQEDRDSGVQRLDLLHRSGQLSDQAYQAAVTALDTEATGRAEELKKGPTYQLLQSEYESQRAFAEGQHGFEQGRGERQFYRDNPRVFDIETKAGGEGGRGGLQAGGGGNKLSGAVWTSEARGGLTLPGGAPMPGEGPGFWSMGGERIRDDVLSFSQTSPEFQGEDFSFATNPEELFGGMFGEEGAPSRGQRSELYNRQRTGGGDRLSPIGVGQSYSWY